MRRQAVLILCFTLALLTPAVSQMSGDQKVLHALNRLTFGARPGDIEEVRQQGLDRWIDAQLHPETIAENPVLEAKLAPLETLRMSTTEMLEKYPGGRMPLPAENKKSADPRPQKIVTRDLMEGKLLRAIYSNRQLDEVLADFWYNHFNVYLDKARTVRWSPPMSAT